MNPESEHVEAALEAAPETAVAAGPGGLQGLAQLGAGGNASLSRMAASGQSLLGAGDFQALARLVGNSAGAQIAQRGSVGLARQLETLPPPPPPISVQDTGSGAPDGGTPAQADVAADGGVPADATAPPPPPTPQPDTPQTPPAADAGAPAEPALTEEQARARLEEQARPAAAITPPAEGAGPLASAARGASDTPPAPPAATMAPPAAPAGPGLDGGTPAADGPAPLASMGQAQRLPGLGDMQAERLAEYATEKAWHQQWRATGSETRGAEDLGLATGALLAGGAEGAAQGAQALVIDTLLNRATRRIPYASGFIAMGQIAYDPQAWWQQSVVQGVGGKLGGGWTLLGSPDWLDKLEGVISIFDGLNAIVGLLSTLCMVVAAASFLLSFVPGLQWLMPFAVMAADWGLLLGNVNTYVGIILSALRLVLMAARYIQIVASSADPAEQRRRAARLRETSRQFFQEYTLRRGARFRDRRAQERREAATGQAEPPPPQRPQGSALERAISVAGGGEAGSMRAQGRTVVSDLGAARRYTSAWAQPVGGESGRTREEWLQNLQTAQAGGDASRPAAFSEEQMRRMQTHAAAEDLPHEQAQAQARVAETERGLADAQAARAAARQREIEAQGEADRARAELGVDRPDEVRARAREEGAARGAVTAAEEHRDSVRDQLAAAERVRDARNEEASRQPHNSARRERAAAAADEVQRLRAELAAAPDAIRDARRGVRAAEAATESARQSEIDERTGGAVPQARAGAESADADLRAAQEARTAAQTRAAELGPEEAARRAAAADTASGEGEAGRAAWWGMQQTRQDFTDPSRAGQGWEGTAETSGYGHQGTGGVVTGQATPSITGYLEGQEHAAVWDPLYNAVTGAHQGTDAEQNVSATMNLEDPPADRERDIDTAAADFARADEEIRQLAFQAEESGHLREEMGSEATVLQGVQALAAANERALAGNRAELQGVRGRQEELSTRVSEHGSAAGGMAGAERPGAALEFVQSFVGLMGRIPSDVVGNAGEGAAGARRLGTAMDAGPQGAQDGQASTSTAASGVQNLCSEADAAEQEHQEADQVLQQMRDAFAEDREEFANAGDVLASVHQQARARIAELESTKGEARERQEAAAGELQSWAQRHREARSGTDAAHGIAPD